MNHGFPPLPKQPPHFDLPPSAAPVPPETQEVVYRTFSIKPATNNVWTTEAVIATFERPHDTCDVYFSPTSIGVGGSENALNVSLALYATSGGVRALVGRGCMFIDPQLSSFGLPFPIRFMCGAQRAGTMYDVALRLMSPSVATFAGIVAAVGYSSGSDHLTSSRERDMEGYAAAGPGRISQSFRYNRPCYVHRIKAASNSTTAVPLYLHIFYKTGRGVAGFTPGTAIADGTPPDDSILVKANDQTIVDFGNAPLVCEQAFFWQASTTRDVMTLPADAIATSLNVSTEYS